MVGKFINKINWKNMSNREIKINSEGVVRLFTVLRFPLICMVVLIHVLQSETYIEDCSSWIHVSFYLIREAILRSVVPVFFVISGYMMFMNVNYFDLITYSKKLHRRIYSLLIPFVLWNLIALIELLIKHLPCFENYFPNLKVQLTLPFFIGTFWAVPEGTCPLLYPLWYVRDLIVMVLFSPIIYWLVKKLRYSFLIILVTLVFSGIKTYPGFSFSSVLFFSIGIYWTMFFHDKVPPTKSLLPFLILWLPMAYIDTFTQNEMMHIISILFGVPSLFLLGIMACRHNFSVPNNLTQSVFWILAVHAILLPYIAKIMFILLHPQNTIFIIFTYFFVWILTVIFSYYTYKFSKKYLPRVNRVLNGGR